jgi:hypothetical protein
MTYSSTIVATVKCLTRLGGVVFVALGVASVGEGLWHGGLLGQLTIGVFAIAFGTLCLSIRDASSGGLEYGLVRPQK